jgi:hypothetical protein
MDSVNKITNTVAKKMGKSADRLLKHKYLNLLVVLLIALYAGMAAPALPNFVVTAVDSTVGKLVFLFLIGFVASRNIQVALMVAVAFVVTLHVSNTRATERFINLRTTELFEPVVEEETEGTEGCTTDEDCTGGLCIGAGEGKPGECEADVAAEFTDFDPTASGYSNFEGFWNGAEGDAEEGFADQVTAAQPAATQEEECDKCEGDKKDKTKYDACRDAAGCDGFTDGDAPEEFSVYPNSGSKYAYSSF